MFAKLSFEICLSSIQLQMNFSIFYVQLNKSNRSCQMTSVIPRYQIFVIVIVWYLENYQNYHLKCNICSRSITHEFFHFQSKTNKIPINYIFMSLFDVWKIIKIIVRNIVLVLDPFSPRILPFSTFNPTNQSINQIIAVKSLLQFHVIRCL